MLDFNTPSPTTQERRQRSSSNKHHNKSQFSSFCSDTLTKRLKLTIGNCHVPCQYIVFGVSYHCHRHYHGHNPKVPPFPHTEGRRRRNPNNYSAHRMLSYLWLVTHCTCLFTTSIYQSLFSTAHVTQTLGIKEWMFTILK